MRENDVRFGVLVPSFPFDESRGSEFVSKTMAYLSGLEDHFDSAWVSDHFIVYGKPSLDILECLATISFLSGVFKKMDFGSIVLCNSFRNPALVAKMGATLDALTGGRFILGIGAGWMEEEHVQYGYEFPPPAVRIKRMEEAVQIIKSLWAEDGVTFEGKYYKVKNAYCNPKPSPPPPIMIGGGGEKMTLRVVARYADWWNFGWHDPSTYERLLGVLEGHCSRIGRDPDEIVKTLIDTVVIADTDEEAWRIAKSLGDEAGDRAQFVGTVETVKDRIGRFVDMGVEHFILFFLPVLGLDGPRLFAEEVVPEYR